jgi:hypothetical protein
VREAVERRAEQLEAEGHAKEAEALEHMLKR